MKRSKIGSLYNICLFIFINIYINNSLIFLLSIILLFRKKDYTIIIFLLIYFIIFLNNNTNNDYIKIGSVDYVNDKYAIVNKILYKCKVYNSDLNVGDIVIFDSSNNKVIDVSNLKNNIKYEYSGDVDVVFENDVKKSIFNYINSSKFKDLYMSIFYNVTNYEYIEFESLSYNLAFYYLLILVYRRNKHISIILLLIYSLLFGFQLKFFLILINYILSYFDLDRIENVSLKVLSILFINRYLFFNYSIVMSIVFSSLYLFNKNKTEPFIIGIIQSLFFGEVRLFSTLFYKVYIFEKILIFIFGAISLSIHSFESIFIKILYLLNNLTSFISISIRGRISILLILILILIFKKFNIRNSLYRYILFIICLLIPFNLFVCHIDFIDVGQGDSALIVDPIGFKTILIDTGSKYNYYKLKKELFNEGIYKIDYLILTHEDDDHSGNLLNLKNDFSISNIINIGEDIKTNSLSLKYLNLGVYDNDNDNSLVYLLNIDEYSVLFTGDISSKVENNIIFNKNINDVDILKVSHHGSSSASSSYFIGSIKPEFAIISTSGMYNHPSLTVVENLKKYNVNTFITKEDGNIKFYFTKFIDYIKTSNNQFVIINK